MVDVHVTDERDNHYFLFFQSYNSYWSLLHLDTDIIRRICNSSCPGLGNHYDKVAEDTDIKGEDEVIPRRSSEMPENWTLRAAPLQDQYGNPGCNTALPAASNGGITF